MALLDKINKKTKSKNLDERSPDPIWQGPCDSGDQGGISFSLLTRWISCRERFRLHAIEGIQVADRLCLPLEFGNLWHICEEEFAKEPDQDEGAAAAVVALEEATFKLAQRFPGDSETIKHWQNIIQTTFIAYVEHWSEHPDVVYRKPLLQEQVFCVPIKLPNGRIVYLKGKWDSVDIIGDGNPKKNAIYIQENKSKSRIDVREIMRQLRFDLQTMIYVVALTEPADQLSTLLELPKIKVAGVRYNVVKRSQHKQTRETAEGFSQRLRGIIDESPDDWFARWKVEISPVDVEEFKSKCLYPVLTNLVNWYDHIIACRAAGTSPFTSPLHWRHPFGVYNSVDENGASEFDDFLETGSRVGLRRVTELFPELQKEEVPK